MPPTRRAEAAAPASSAGQPAADDDDDGGGPRVAARRAAAALAATGLGAGSGRGLGHQPLAQGRPRTSASGAGTAGTSRHEVTAGLDELDEVLVGDALAPEGALETVRRTVQYWHADFSLPSPA